MIFKSCHVRMTSQRTSRAEWTLSTLRILVDTQCDDMVATCFQGSSHKNVMEGHLFKREYAQKTCLEGRLFECDGDQTTCKRGVYLS